MNNETEFVQEAFRFLKVVDEEAAAISVDAEAAEGAEQLRRRVTKKICDEIRNRTRLKEHEIDS